MAKRLAYAAPGTTTLVQVDASNNMFAVKRDNMQVPILDMYTLGTAMLLYFTCIMTQSPVSPELMVCLGTVIVNCRIDGHEAIMELKEFNDVKVLVESDRVITFPCESRVILDLDLNLNLDLDFIFYKKLIIVLITSTGIESNDEGFASLSGINILTYTLSKMAHQITDLSVGMLTVLSWTYVGPTYEAEVNALREQLRVLYRSTYIPIEELAGYAIQIKVLEHPEIASKVIFFRAVMNRMRSCTDLLDTIIHSLTNVQI